MNEGDAAKEYGALEGDAETYRSDEEGSRFEKNMNDFVDALTTRPDTVLDEAAGLVDGDRQAYYGHPLDNYRRVGMMATALFEHKLKDGFRIDELDCVRFLAGMKLIRDANRPKRDNWVDVAGYSRVAEMVAAQLDLFEAVP
jgi:hypothetical protein